MAAYNERVSNFITFCNIKYGGKFDYSKMDYINSITPVVIICPIHGEFKQVPSDHRSKKHGCNRCGIDACAIAQKEKANIKFLKLAREIHGNKYSYEKTIYTGSHNIIKVICNEHGEFNIRPTHHIHMKSGCQLCANYNRTIYSEKYFQNNPEQGEKMANLYFIELKDNGAHYLKIGISQKLSFGARMKALPVIRIIATRTMPLYEAFVREQILIEKFKKSRYVPFDKITGWTECFNINSEHHIAAEFIK